MEVCQLPEIYQTNLKLALQILKEEGCSAVFLFGSLTTGLFKPDSDIDLAIQGCPPRKFFPLLARLLNELDYPVDLLDLDEDDILARHLLAQKEMIQLG